jgi:hypothetical protein
MGAVSRFENGWVRKGLGGSTPSPSSSRFPDRRRLPPGEAGLRRRLAPLRTLPRAGRVANTVPLAYGHAATRQETESPASGRRTLGGMAESERQRRATA